MVILEFLFEEEGPLGQELFYSRPQTGMVFRFAVLGESGRIMQNDVFADFAGMKLEF
jgi:hypothetical protein